MLVYLWVVIRFQICIFDILNTAENLLRFYEDSCDSLSNLYLWHIKYSSDVLRNQTESVVIRFQICIFDILNTASKNAFPSPGCCDSLSNLYLWHIKYSVVRDENNMLLVVIRFQICIFDILNTARWDYEAIPRQLWFAFKFVSLTY